MSSAQCKILSGSADMLAQPVFKKQDKTKKQKKKKKTQTNKEELQQRTKELNNLKCHTKCSHSFKMLISYESVNHPLLIKKMNTGTEEKLEFLNKESVWLFINTW